ncbi:MAG: iron-sulfur cluster repair di-iron protein [Acidobacteriota bacterium]
MNHLQSKTIGEIAIETPASTRIFEEYKIDYCCHGNTEFNEACELAGVSPVEISEKIAEVIRAGDTYSTTTSCLKELIEYILDKHHLYTHQEIAMLPALMKKVANRHGDSHPELFKMEKLFAALCKDLTSHMYKEERVLFPYIVELEAHVMDESPLTEPHFGTVNNPMRMLKMEHEDAGAILEKLRSMSKDYELPEGACTSFRTLYSRLEEFERDLHQHIHLENNILFPTAIEIEKKMFLDILGLV